MYRRDQLYRQVIRAQVVALVVQYVRSQTVGQEEIGLFIRFVTHRVPQTLPFQLPMQPSIMMAPGAFCSARFSDLAISTLELSDAFTFKNDDQPSRPEPIT